MTAVTIFCVLFNLRFKSLHSQKSGLHSAENDRTQSDNNHSLKCLQTGLARVFERPGTVRRG